MGCNTSTKRALSLKQTRVPSHVPLKWSIGVKESIWNDVFFCGSSSTMLSEFFHLFVLKFSNHLPKEWKLSSVSGKATYISFVPLGLYLSGSFAVFLSKLPRCQLDEEPILPVLFGTCRPTGLVGAARGRRRGKEKIDSVRVVLCFCFGF